MIFISEDHMCIFYIIVGKYLITIKLFNHVYYLPDISKNYLWEFKNKNLESHGT